MILNPFRQRAEPPIQNVGAVDLMGRRMDGGVDLVIIAQALDDSPETQQLLRDKLQGYLEVLARPGFHAEFGAPEPDRCSIRIITPSVHPSTAELLASLRPTVQAAGASLVW